MKKVYFSILFALYEEVMIDHVALKVRDLQTSKEFYQKNFDENGFPLAFGKEGEFWAFDMGSRCLFEVMQFHGKEKITGCHVAFRMKNEQQVKDLFKSAIRAGGKDNGQPGPRPQYTSNYYAAFILDPDGHNIEFMFDS